MKILVLDLETTVQKVDGKNDNSPHNPDNRCVSADFGWLGWDTLDTKENLIFYHNEQEVPDSPEPLKKAIEEADLCIMHNAKFDTLWLKAMGLPVPKKVYCTMIAEYLLSKAQRQEINLKAVAERRNVTRKKSDLVDELFKSGTGFEAMPLDVVKEYSEADIISCGEIYLSQLNDFAKEENKSLVPVRDMMNEMLLFLVELENNGVQIDKDALAQVEQEFRDEKAKLEVELNNIVEEVMGDTPVNLNSGADMTAVIYSRKVKDREKHRRVWNIGVGANGKPLYPPKMNQRRFIDAVRETTTVIEKTMAVSCPECKGRGTIQKMKKDGKPFKNRTKCPSCLGAGALYQPTGQVAGLKLHPINPSFASINGFKTDKNTLKVLINQAKQKENLIAVDFLTKITRLNAISTYIDTFIEGINNWTRPKGTLHTNFNQCIAATGRLSSSNINLQNMPKRGFPIRKAFVSRFENGSIISADYSGLEWRVAAQLSNDTQAINDILSGKDAHRQTACIIHQCEPDQVTKDMRQGAKAHSFAPLFGSTGNGQTEHIKRYYDEFFEIYPELGQWHRGLMDGVLKNKTVQTPSGRQYMWPSPRRLANGGVSNATQIKNYPVQGFAADLVQLACIRTLREFKRLDLKSKLILTVHDSIDVDAHPDERSKVINALHWAMTKVVDEIKDRWNYTFVLPLDIEISEGKNWLDQVELD